MNKQPNAPHDPDAYIDELILQLRLLDVPGDRIGHIIAEAESHLAESGEDPVETFGTPRDYARELATREGITLPRIAKSNNVLVQLLSTLRPRVWAACAVGLVVVMAGTHVGVGGVFNLVVGSPAPFGLNPWVAVLIGVAVLVCCIVLVCRLQDPIVDPRSGRRVTFDRRGRRRIDRT